MNLSNDLVEQFVKATNEDAKERQNETLYGTAVVFEGKMYARLDGSQQLTPIKTTTNIREGDRVIVSVQRHSAVVTGNISSPSASIEDLSDSHNNTIATCKELIAKKVSTDDLEAATARIGVLETDYAIINGNLEAANANITKLEADKLEAKSADLKYATIENLNATNANVKNLTANHAEFEKAVASDFEATNADIKKLDADKLNATDANLKYANIDFSNIKIAAIENLYATSGIIKDIVVSGQRITGTLVGVTITGDLIEGNTVVADKLVIKGSDGLYYKLNTDGITTEAQQTDYNSLNGSIIKAKSITATKVDVTDLVAFGATIGGLKIENGSIHSVSKDSASNTTRGLFFGKDGQAAIGDGTNFLKYFKDSDGNYKLAISADTITIKGGQKNLNTELDEINKKVEKGKVVDEVNSELKIDGKSIAFKTGHFTIDSKNLKLDSAGNATFSGKVKGASMEANAITGGTITGATIDGNTITGGTIDGNTITGGTIKGATINGNTITGGTIKGATINGNTITGGTIKGATIDGNTITGGTIRGTSVKVSNEFAVNASDLYFGRAPFYPDNLDKLIGDYDNVFDIPETHNYLLSVPPKGKTLKSMDRIESYIYVAGDQVLIGNLRIPGLVENNHKLNTLGDSVRDLFDECFGDAANAQSTANAAKTAAANAQSTANAAKKAAANAQSTANAAKTAADNKPGWDTVNNKANSDTVKSVIRWRSQSRSLSLAANGEDYWNFSNLGRMSGYTRTAMVVSISGSASSFMMQYQHTYNDNGTQIRCRNFASWAFNGSIYVAVLYVHEGYC